MLRALVVVVVVVVALAAGCGRVGFEPLGDGAIASGDPRLASIQLLSGGDALAIAVTPAFDPSTLAYAADVGLALQNVEIAAVPVDPTTTITIEATPVAAGTPSSALALALGATTFTIIGTATGGATASYTVTVDRAAMLAQQAYVKASNTEAFDQFGESVAISGDTLAVGAWFEASNATGIDGDQTNTLANMSGAVYVFVRSGSTWTQQAYVKASNTESGDNFGAAVSLSGDTLVVGATSEDSGATGVDGDQDNDNEIDSGAVYVFTRSGTTWTQQAYVKASNTNALAQFGWSVSVSGDTLAVGAHLESSDATGIDGDQGDTSATNAGAVYVFTRDGTTWSQQAYVKASNTDAGDEFGDSVSASGDTLVVGAHFESSGATGIDGVEADNSAASAGAVYVFARVGQTWTQQAYVKASNTAAFDQFGASVSVWGDTVAVGAVDESSDAVGVDGDQSNNAAANSGAAYVFTRTGTTWAQQAYVKASNTATGQQFGDAISISGDTLAIGAYYESSAATGVDGNQADTTASESGAVYLFGRTGTTWAQQAYIKASNTNASDQFGGAVAVSGDTIVVGAFEEASNAIGIDGNQGNNSSSFAGAAYVFE